MTDERFAALEAEVARLKSKLERPEVAIKFGKKTESGHSWITMSFENVGALPVFNWHVTAKAPNDEGKVTINCGPGPIPSALFPGQTYQALLSEDSLIPFRAAPQCRIIEVVSDKGIVGQSSEKDIATFDDLLATF